MVNRGTTYPIAIERRKAAPGLPLVLAGKRVGVRRTVKPAAAQCTVPLRGRLDSPPQAARRRLHSTRVGATQDMLTAGLGMSEIMHAGGWRTPQMVARYGERAAVKQGAAAKLAAMQGRD